MGGTPRADFCGTPGHRHKVILGEKASEERRKRLLFPQCRICDTTMTGVVPVAADEAPPARRHDSHLESQMGDRRPMLRERLRSASPISDRRQ